MAKTPNNIPHGYKATALGIIPQEWEIKTLNKACYFLDSQRIPIKDSDRAKISGIYPYYGASGIIDYVNSYIFDDDLILLAEDGANIINRSTPIAFLVNGKIWVNNHAHVLKAKPSFDRYYLCVYLESLKYNKYNTGTAQPKLNREVCEKIPILTPPLAEQKKIAEVLGVWDKAIEKQSQLIEQLTLRKRGLMQQLLTAKRRLPGFSGPWVRKKVKDIFKITRGNVLSAAVTTPSKVGENLYPVFSSQTQNKGIMGYFSQYLFEDCITWTTDGANAGDVNFRKGKFYCTNVCGVLKSDAGYANECIASILNKIAKFHVSYIGNPKLMNNVMAGIPIVIPQTIEEQTAIAQVLTAADREIELAQQKLELLRQQKRGLMQQLLTGKKRVI